MCSLFGINFRKIFQKRANLLNQFYLDDLSAELIQNHKITTVSGIIYQVSPSQTQVHPKPDYEMDGPEKNTRPPQNQDKEMDISVRRLCGLVEGWTVSASLTKTNSEFRKHFKKRSS